MSPSRPSKTRAQTRGLFIASLAAAVCSLTLVGFAGFSGALGLSAANAVPETSATGTPSASSALDASIPPGQERYIVATTQTNTDAATKAVVDAGGFIVAQYPKSIVGFAATMTPAAAATLALQPGIEYVERDAIVRTLMRPLATANDSATGGAVIADTGCLTTTMPAGDDISSASTALGFTANWFGTAYSKLYVNNNGGIAFDDGGGAFTEYTHNIATTTRPSVLALGTDVDTTRSTKTVTYGALTNTIGGHTGFCVNYVQVSHYGSVAVAPYSAQLLILNRSDRRAGDIDIIFNYDTMSSAMSTYPLEIGYANPANRSTSFRMTGSDAPSTLLDGGAAALTTHKTDLMEGTPSASAYTSKNGRYVYGIVNSAAPTSSPTSSATPTATPTASCGGTPPPSGTQACAPWGLDRIDQRTAALDGLFTPAGTGSGVRAYVVDTGIYAANLDFGSRVASGFTAVNDSYGTGDCNGHGTHVSGTIAGTTYGVAKLATLVPVRVLDCNGSGTTSAVIAGLDWVISNHTSGPAVLNMSLGGGFSKSLNDAVAAVVADGVTVVVAAGNSTADACASSPASEPTAITVGATDRTDARASFSNYGACLDIFAPGVNILSAGITSPTAAATLSGTSMASPDVAGTAAVYLALNPSATPAQVNTALQTAGTPSVVTDSLSTNNRLLYARSFGTSSVSPAPSVTPIA
ncbi:MAG: S8 family peptidase, partial [Actinomycetes bacterium]